MYSCLSCSGIGGENRAMRDIDINTIPSEKEEEWINEEGDDDDEKYCPNGRGRGGRRGGGGGAPTTTTRRKKLRLTHEQSLLLEQSFRPNQTLNPKQKEDLAMQLMLKPRQVEVWFQNRRARSKVKQTENEYDYLKRWYNSVSEENKRLQMEVEELRAINVISRPLSVAASASTTTTTMCPRCERITTVVHNHGGAAAAAMITTTVAMDMSTYSGS